MGNYKKTKKNQEEETLFTPIIVMLAVSVCMMIGMFMGNMGIGIVAGLVIGTPVGLWLDSDNLKNKRAQKKADKLAILKEEERRAKIRQEKKNKK